MAAVFIHFDNDAGEACDGCGTRGTIMHLVLARTGHSLSLCGNCLAALTIALRQAMAKLHGDTPGAAALRDSSSHDRNTMLEGSGHEPLPFDGSGGTNHRRFAFKNSIRDHETSMIIAAASQHWKSVIALIAGSLIVATLAARPGTAARAAAAFSNAERLLDEADADGRTVRPIPLMGNITATEIPG